MNLPQRFKLADPAYQDVPKEKIPVIIMNKFIVRVIAGEAFGQKAVVNTKVPIQLLDVHMESGAEFKHNIPPYVVLPPNAHNTRNAHNARTSGTSWPTLTMNIIFWWAMDAGR